MTTTNRDELLAVIGKLPKRTSFEDAIDRLALLAELKHRTSEVRKGTAKTVTQAEAIRQMKGWCRETDSGLRVDSPRA